ncbi:MAG TPA: hypothetical protein VMI54_28575 [Polyangiaceae bacterium]|nr:hypothetical protein [Polyangiaceae bacterium]
MADSVATAEGVVVLVVVAVSVSLVAVADGGGAGVTEVVRAVPPLALPGEAATRVCALCQPKPATTPTAEPSNTATAPERI